MTGWSKWRPFPDSRKQEYLCAPFGAGVYELRNRSTGELILFGSGGNVAYRMSSLLPKPYGCGTRKNIDKRNYVFETISDIEYRTFASHNAKEAKALESNLKSNGTYRFKK